MQAIDKEDSESNSQETVSKIGILVCYIFNLFFSSGGAAGMVMMSGGGDEEEEEREKERLREESENRAMKNKLWRERREMERLEIP